MILGLAFALSVENPLVNCCDWPAIHKDRFSKGPFPTPIACLKVLARLRERLVFGVGYKVIILLRAIISQHIPKVLETSPFDADFYI